MKHKAKTLDEVYNYFYLKYTKNGDKYEPDSLRAMLGAIDRFLQDKGSNS